MNAGAGGLRTSTSDGLSQAGHGCVVLVHGTTTDVFTHTGAVQTWTAPAGVESVHVHLVGAGGGGGGDVGAVAGNGGGGGYATGDLTVVPGSQYQIIVGGGGRHQCRNDHTNDDVTARRNSSFGGGAAGYGAVEYNCTWASGGGRSAIRFAGEDGDIVTAGGGGGGG